MFHNIHYLLPELFLTVFLTIQLTLTAVFSKIDQSTSIEAESQNYKLGLLTIFSLLIASYMFLTDGIDTDVLVSSNIFKLNIYTQRLKSVVCVIAAIILIFNFNTSRELRIAQAEFSMLVTLSVLGFLTIIGANELITLFLGLELYSLSLYILTTINKWSEKSTEAGLKYFVLGSLAAGIFLFGASLIYLDTGELNYSSINIYLSTHEASNLFILGAVFIIISILFKLAAAPLHMWAPDVYDGAPIIVTAYFATITKLPLLAVLYHLLYIPFYTLSDVWQNILIITSVFSLVVGSIAGLNQTKIKRLMAYSSISHIGFILLGLIARSELGLNVSTVYVIIYLITTLAFFGIIINFLRKTDYVIELAGLGKKNPILASTLSLLLFSSAGVPPLAGFYAKFWTIKAILDVDLYFLAIIAVLCSTISLIYYIRLIKWMFFKDSSDYNTKITADILKQQDITYTINLIIVGVLTFLVVSLFFFPELIYYFMVI